MLTRAPAGENGGEAAGAAGGMGGLAGVVPHAQLESDVPSCWYAV